MGYDDKRCGEPKKQRLWRQQFLWIFLEIKIHDALILCCHVLNKTQKKVKLA